MKVIRPVTVTDAVLISSTVAEPSGSDPAAWNAATNYSLGALVYRATTHRRYENLAAGVSALLPESTPTRWKDLGATLRWAPFDDQVGTSATATGSISYVLAPGICNAVALLVDGDSVTVTVTDGAGGPEVYSRTVSLDVSLVTDWYEYFFEPFSKRTMVVLPDLPPYLAARITITVNGTGTVGLGGIVVGTAVYIGAMHLGARAGIRDYSTKTVDDVTGVVSLTEGRYRDRVRGTVRVPDAAVNKVHALMKSLRAKPIFVIGDDEGDYEPLSLFGFTQEFELSVTYASSSVYTFSFEGFT